MSGTRSLFTLLQGIPQAVFLFSSSAVLLPATATAQLALEEVIVTARRREETLINTPVAVTALSGSQLEEQGIRNIYDLERIVPNIDIANDVSAQVYIRGVGARNSRPNYDSGVGIYVDGVYQSRMQGAIRDNVDIASIQVLRGPQGTLFGKNTTGGAVLYTSNRPMDEFEGNVEARIGNYDRQDIKATVNIPISEDSLYSRFSAWSVNRDGYVDNHFDGSELNEESRWGLQG